MRNARALSRRDFLTFRRTERGRALEVSCRTLYMRCADAETARGAEEAWEPWMGEPPAVWDRLSADDLVASLEADLAQVQVLTLREPEWLRSLAVAARVDAVVAAFRARGGTVDVAGAPAAGTQTPTRSPGPA